MKALVEYNSVACIGQLCYSLIYFISERYVSEFLCKILIVICTIVYAYEARHSSIASRLWDRNIRFSRITLTLISIALIASLYMVPDRDDR